LIFQETSGGMPALLTRGLRGVAQKGRMLCWRGAISLAPRL